jgi:hypothetical protein
LRSLKNITFFMKLQPLKMKKKHSSETAGTTHLQTHLHTPSQTKYFFTS